MQRYDEYKDSGVEWIGDIPEDWEVKKLKYIGKSIIGLTYSPDEVIPSDGVLVLRSSNIQEGKLSLKDCVYVDKVIPEKLVVKKGDILICSRNGSRALIGKNITIDEELEGNTFGAFMTVFRTNYYEFVSKYFNSQVFNGQSGLFLTSTVNQLTIHTLNNFYIALPPQEEQVVIATYLTKKTTEIDELIAQKEKLLALYEEEKIAIINQAVTKGVDSDVKMKESCASWLKEMPEDWETRRVGYSFRIIGSGTTPKTSESAYYNNGDIFWLNTGDLNNGYIYDTSKKITDKALEDISTLKIYPTGSLVIAMYGATIGKLGITKIETTVNQACCVLNNSDVLKNKYLFYWLILNKRHIITLGSGGGQPNISQEIIRNLKVQTPPIEEQDRIIEYIENEFDKIEENKKRVTQLIKLKKEYRTALISEVVTGKIKVPEGI